MVTAIMQSTSADGSHLRSTERGRFRLTASAQEQAQLQGALSLIGDAAESGFLRLDEEHASPQHFRVHASLAPAYGFSYRGAYYPVKLDIKDFNRLKSAKTDEDLEKVARTIANNTADADTDDFPLYPLEDLEDAN